MENTEIKIINAEGKKVSDKSVKPGVLVKGTKRALHQIVRWQRAKKRAGTHAVQTRAEMTGGGIKPWKQKGTGKARAGSNTSPLWVGGGIAHGPKPRKYDFKINKKERKKALASALEARNSESRLIIVDDFGLTKIGTKSATKILRSIGIPDRENALVVVPEGSDILMKSLRNIEGIRVIRDDGLNVYDILRAHYVVIVADAFERIEERLATR